MKTFCLPFYPSMCINVSLIVIEDVLILWLEFKVMFYSNENQDGVRFPSHREPESTQEWEIKAQCKRSKPRGEQLTNFVFHLTNNGKLCKYCYLIIVSCFSIDQQWGDFRENVIKRVYC